MKRRGEKKVQQAKRTHDTPTSKKIRKGSRISPEAIRDNVRSAKKT